jgi:hypothetical protein
MAALLVVGACGGPVDDVAGPATCQRPGSVANATGCALLFGTVTSTRGEALDGIEGSIRPSATCACAPVTLQVDDRGLFSATVYRLGGSGVVADTGRATIVVLATAAKYPRHVTGAPYFDTLAIALRFAAIGAAPVPQEVRLRIPLP